MKNNKQTLNPTDTPMTRREDEAVETEEHDKHTDLSVSDVILYDHITIISSLIVTDL